MISVCMATYNGEKYLRQQIDSILAQLSEQDEIIISDDGSTDLTKEIIQSYNDPRIKIFSNRVCHGVNANFNNALKHAKGDYIFLSDQDDVWVEGKVSACIAALSENDCVIHDAIVVDQDLNVIKSSFFDSHKSGHGVFKNIYRNTYLGCCMAFKRQLLQLIIPVPDTKAFFHDNWIGLLADWKYKIVFVPFKGLLFRRHNLNTSTSAKKSKYSITRKIQNRIIQLILTIRRIYFNR